MSIFTTSIISTCLIIPAKTPNRSSNYAVVTGYEPRTDLQPNPPADTALCVKVAMVAIIVERESKTRTTIEATC